MAARSVALLAAVTVVAAVLTTGTATASLPDPPGSHDVTLLTGDRVTVTEVHPGRHSVRVQPGPGRQNQVFFQQSQGDHLVVLPGDVAGQVASGQLDRRLFDVTELIRQGYDDASRQDLPVIVSGFRARHGASVVRELPSIGATAVSLRKGQFWASSATRIRLDGKVRANLDQSVPQVGAPQAWQAGYTGKGVKVAVIDTGYDREHPDLKNVVVGEKDFTGEGVQDGDGHGTHVASTLAGSGAASNGRYRGVAPDAGLLIGKALGNDGSGSLSAVIEASQWAADSGAKVVSMSLGSGSASDGSDDLSQAINTISRQQGTLFVVAAGNEGRDSSIGTPGAAETALTVGSVSKQDVPSKFSSRGPLIRNFAVKPDITAPGENIVAARAGNGGYTSATGTSMSTPHVAGAAAILAQQHPQWTPDELKSALTSSAKPDAGQSVYAQGAGRLDVARAVGQQVRASASVGFGQVAWPHDQARPETREVTYTNSGDQPVELALSFTTTAPAGVLTASANKIVVPAGGSSKVQILSNPKALGVAAGSYSARLTATDGKSVVQTAIGITSERESYDLTIKMVDRLGKPASDDVEHSLSLMGDELGIDDGGILWTEGGEAKVRVPKGPYRIAGLISTPKDGRIGDVTLVAAPDVRLTKTTTIILDARPGKRVSIKPQRRSAVDVFRSFGAVTGNGHGSTQANTVYVQDNAVPLYGVPVRSGAKDTFATTYVAMATDSLDAELIARGPVYNVVEYWPARIPDRLSFTVRDADLAKVAATFSSKNGKSGLVARELHGFPPMSTFTAAHATRVHQPGERTEFFSPGEVFWINQLYRDPGVIGGQPPYPFGAVWAVGYHKPGPVKEPWNHAVEGPGLPGPARGPARPDDTLWAGREGDTIFSRAPLLADVGQYQHTWLDFDHVKGGWTLYRNGTRIGTGNQYNAVSIDAPPEPATYRLVGTADRSVTWSELSTHVEAAWTFRSEHVPGEDVVRLPMLAVKFVPQLDPYNRAKATPTTIVPMRVERQGGTADLPLTALAVQVSFDDGKSWRPAPVVRTGRAGHAVVRNPVPVTGKTFVSLRVNATDSGGNSVEQTVIRAYELGTG